MVGQAAVKRIGPDLVAGLSVAGLVLPEALAYAGIAGVPPLAGLLAAIAGLLTYALLGTSRYAIVAATSSSAAVLASALHSLPGVSPGQALQLAAAMVLLAGLLFLLCGVLRLGRMAQFIARPVVRGFTLGLALIITARIQLDQQRSECRLRSMESAQLRQLARRDDERKSEREPAHHRAGDELRHAPEPQRAAQQEQQPGQQYHRRGELQHLAGAHAWE